MLEIDRILLEISRKLDSSRMFNPTNEEEERGKAFTNPGYNPRFEYGNIPSGIETMHKYIDSLDVGSVERARDGAFGCLEKEGREWLAGRYAGKQVKLRHLADMAAGARDGDLDKFEENAREYHGLPSEGSLEYARKTIQDIVLDGLEKGNKDGKITDEEALGTVNKELESHGIENWEVLLDPDVSADASVHGVQREYRIRKGGRFSSRFPYILKRHEMVHVMRSENGWSQPSLLFVTYMPDYPHSEDSAVFIEEALATDSEERALGQDKSRLFNHCLRALAVDQAAREGFTFVYNSTKLLFCRAYGLYMDNDFVKWNAWKIARRVKAGLHDTSRPGGRKYPHVYLTGRLALKKHRESGGDCRKLYVGRIGLNDLPHIEGMLAYGFLKPPKYLPLDLQ